jgi:hypothetical protein
LLHQAISRKRRREIYDWQENVEKMRGGEMLKKAVCA